MLAILDVARLCRAVIVLGTTLLSGTFASVAFASDQPVSTATGLLTIVDHGASNYEILVAAGAPEGVREAGTELQRIIQKATGTRLPVVMTRTPGKARLVLGSGARDLNLGSRGRTLSLPNDAYRIWVDGADLYLVGQDDDQSPFFTLNNNQSASAGTYYAVVDFARRFLAARWYMPGPLGEEIPETLRVTIPLDLDLTSAPRFPVRSIDVTQRRTPERERQLVSQGDLLRSYFDPRSVEDASRWGRHLRLGHNFQLNLEHSWYQWIPAEQPTKYSSRAYGKTNPEYFAVPGGVNGKYYYGSDNSHGGQLCISNPDVAIAFAGNIVKYAKASGERAFSLSQNDGSWDCAASCCGHRLIPFVEANGPTADELIDFSNRIASLVLAEVPGARFGLYAYNTTLQPPETTTANIRISISDVHNGLPYMFARIQERNDMERLIRGWRAKAGSVVLTTYYTFEGHYSLPWSTPDAQKWLIDLLAEYPGSSGVRMNYAQLDAPPIGALGPDPWILSELLWTPEQPLEPLLAEFYRGAFGPVAGPLLRRYFEVIDTAMAKAVRQVPYRGANSVKGYIAAAYSPIRGECRQLMDQAIGAVNDEPERFRWRVDRLARGWRLTELTLDAMDADRAGEASRAAALWTQRRTLLADPASQLALAPASTDFMEDMVSLGDKH